MILFQVIQLMMAKLEQNQTSNPILVISQNLHASYL
jgi:hypothetical protein